MSFIVYKITDGIKTYVGSTTRTLPARKSQHHVYFKDGTTQWKLYAYWREVGWDNMKFSIVKTGINDKVELKQIEQETIKSIPKEECLNTIKAFCPDYEATRSVNSEAGEIEKIEMKRKTRMDYYYRKKEDPNWVEKERERNRIRMKQTRTDPAFKENDKSRRTAKITCLCGTTITVDAKSRHEKTRKHLNLMEIRQITAETI